MTGKQWTIFGILVAASLGLAALGFAAMSTNPPFTVLGWVPMVFFIAAGIVFIFSLGYMFHGTFDITRKQKDDKRRLNDGTFLLQLLDEMHEKISSITKNTIDRIEHNNGMGWIWYLKT